MPGLWTGKDVESRYTEENGLRFRGRYRGGRSKRRPYGKISTAADRSLATREFGLPYRAPVSWLKMQSQFFPFFVQMEET